MAWEKTRKGLVNREKRGSPKFHIICNYYHDKNIITLTSTIKQFFLYKNGNFPWERLIVYNYIPNHSLITILHGQLVQDCLLYIESYDVYKFGVLLLEIISASKPLKKLPGGVKRDLSLYIYDRNRLKPAIMIAMRCTDSNPENRTRMLRRRRRRTELSLMAMEDKVSEEDEGQDNEDVECDGLGKGKYNVRRNIKVGI
ncbi:hypothetical protein K2173_026601 [Erythroxylum novogranatense]|uniref:Serine-threonine/tyrosine-protein kinase catalytic domain-containing protein n=1 Tax=Erythroxylum novogranatense TaxID=1862640 RepID=A0AAV8TZD8_9ROSI|nr:hypothetical protein K2173_026601 [Erythroxylum novogranatense]